jgi:hypothetical protein
MSWTCDQVESRLMEAMDGLLDSAELAEFHAHVQDCAQCAPLYTTIENLVGQMHSMEQLEEPPRLVYSILDKTLGPRETVSGWQGFWNFLRGFGSPKFAYGAASVLATCIIVVSASGASLRKPKLADFKPANIALNVERQGHLVYARAVKSVSDWRVVYEIQSRLRSDSNDLQTPPEQSLPKPGGEKDPGQSDGQKPGTPRQQNRANEIARQLEVLAMEAPVVLERSYR